jgi:hypothetical protein
MAFVETAQPLKKKKRWWKGERAWVEEATCIPN